MRVERLGRVPYAAAHERMKGCLEARIRGELPDTLLLCEHDRVFTLGRRRSARDNVLAPGDIPIVEVERGGDVTYHGPGQLVGYPILALPEGRQDLHAYLRMLEQLFIDLLAELGVEAGRDDRNTGVWIAGKKAVAIGIACRKWVTWHGFALNVTLDLEPYSRINPCGLESQLVTRLSDHVTDISLEEVEALVAERFASHYQRWIESAGNPG